jgi:hypothetical protein
MATIEERWGAYDTIATAISGTDLNGLANGSAAISSAIVFTAAGVDRKKFIDIEIYLSSVNLGAYSNCCVNVWILARTDGTNFEYGGTAAIPVRPPDLVIPVPNVDGAKRLFGRLGLTTPDQGKILIQNRTGAAFAADTNSSVKYYTYGNELVG